MSGFTVAARLALFLKSKQRGVAGLTALGLLDPDAERHVKLTQEELLCGDKGVTLRQVTQVNDIPCGKGLFAIVVEGGFLHFR